MHLSITNSANGNDSHEKRIEKRIMLNDHEAADADKQNSQYHSTGYIYLFEVAVIIYENHVSSLFNVQSQSFQGSIIFSTLKIPIIPLMTNILIFFLLRNNIIHLSNYAEKQRDFPTIEPCRKIYSTNACSSRLCSV